MKRKKLVIISHTPHYQTVTNQVVGWSPTVNEVNFMSQHWEEVVHIACLHSGEAPSSTTAYANENTRFVPIPPYGGKTFIDKLLIFIKIPKIIRQLRKNLTGATEVQLRVPTAMGLFLIPYFAFFVQRKFTFWVKYAGDWNHKQPPLSYAIQRRWLKRNLANCAVTLNGFWPDLPVHCHSFENPCLTQHDIVEGKKVSNTKQFEAPFTFTFVGRLEDAKGVSRILEAFKKIPLDTIQQVHFIGDGHQMDHYKNQAAFLKEKVSFHGFLNSAGVHSILKETHFLLLPSTASEGFPKVIAEAACYGAVPVVSNVGSIAHYIHPKNGFVWDTQGKTTFDHVLEQAITSTPEDLKELSNNVISMANAFTFDSYFNKLNKLIF